MSTFSGDAPEHGSQAQPSADAGMQNPDSGAPQETTPAPPVDDEGPQALTEEEQYDQVAGRGGFGDPPAER